MNADDLYPNQSAPASGRTFRLAGFAWAAAYALVALCVAGAWTGIARTEWRRPNFASVTAIRDDRTTTPFVYRRLAVDVADWAGRAAPTALVARFSDAADNNRQLHAIVRDYLAWPRPDDATLLGVFAACAVSVFGFIYVSRGVLLTLYAPPPLMARVWPACMGVALLGGVLDAKFHLYPYDLPNAFVFSLGLLAALRGSWWLLPIMAAAAFNKETSLLLIPAAYLVWPGRRRPWVLLLAMACIWAAIQWHIRTHHAGQDNIPFNKLRRNLAEIAYFLACWSWLLPALIVLALRAGKVWPVVPIAVRRLMIVPAALVSVALFKGWLEELRSYSEGMLPLGLLLTQVTLIEANRAGWMSPKGAKMADFSADNAPPRR